VNDNALAVVVIFIFVVIPVTVTALYKPLLRALVARLLKDLGERIPEREPSLDEATAVLKRWIRRRFYGDQS
jgi:hypothetical protein